MAFMTDIHAAAEPHDACSVHKMKPVLSSAHCGQPWPRGSGNTPDSRRVSPSAGLKRAGFALFPSAIQEFSQSPSYTFLGVGGRQCPGSPRTLSPEREEQHKQPVTETISEGDKC